LTSGLAPGNEVGIWFVGPLPVLGSRVKGFCLGFWGFGFQLLVLGVGFGGGFWVLGFGFGVWGLGFGDWSLGFGLWGLGFDRD